MAVGGSEKEMEWGPEKIQHLLRRHFLGALVRSGASVIMWLCAVAAYFFGVISHGNIVGITASVVYLILINPPTLWILKRIKAPRLFERFSVFINFLEILGYTSIVYFMGGVRSLWLTLLYAALATFVSVVGPPRLPFFITSLCALALSTVVGLEYFGFIPSWDPLQEPAPHGMHQALNLMACVCLLYVVTFISSYTSSLLKKAKKQLREQKNIELGQSRAELEAAGKELKRRNVELELAMIKARESDRSKSEFLATMSHELRTPLNHIMGFTELVVDKKIGELNDLQEEYLHDVLKSSGHLLSLINDILDLSKIEAGKMELQPSEVHLQDLLEGSMVMLKERALKHAITLKLSLDGIPEVIRADERKLKQILFNLLSNAVKFTPEGGEVRLRAELAEGSRLKAQHESAVGDGLKASQKYVCISVTDTGIGIKREDLKRIFKPFEQVDNSASRRYDGTGLGLSLTRSLVELHGGEIWAESEGEGKGSTFCLVIPA